MKRRLERGPSLTEKLSWVFSSPWRFIKTACFVTGAATLGLLGLLVAYTIYFFQTLPNLKHTPFTKLRQTAEQRVSRNLENKRSFYHWTGIKEVSRDLLYTIVMSEDGDFFEHDGINLDAIANSLAENIRERRNAYGASTISQQVVKNLFLGQEKTFARKVKEFLIVRQMERYFSKNEILELYLNVAEFGPDIYGVAAAAQNFFHKKPSELNAAEGAFMAIMLPSPKRHYYAVFQNHNLTKQKRRHIDRILRDMVYHEFISESQYRIYSRYPFFESAPRVPASRSKSR